MEDTRKIKNKIIIIFILFSFWLKSKLARKMINCFVNFLSVIKKINNKKNAINYPSFLFLSQSQLPSPSSVLLHIFSQAACESILFGATKSSAQKRCFISYMLQSIVDLLALTVVVYLYLEL